MNLTRVRRTVARTLFLVALALAVPVQASAAPTELAAKVVVIGVPGLSWFDVQNSPELSALVGQSNVGSITVKTAALAPIPIPSDSVAVSVNKGAFRSCRSA